MQWHSPRGRGPFISSFPFRDIGNFLLDITLVVGDGVVFAIVGAFVGSSSICAASFAKVPEREIVSPVNIQDVVWTSFQRFFFIMDVK